MIALRPAVLAVVVASVGACRGSGQVEGYAPSTGGDAERGRALIAERNCGACHRIPGVAGANGTFAVPLAGFPQRSYIVGLLPNTPENLVRWIRDPANVQPGTAMPSVGLDEQQARDVAAYLYTLRE